MSMHSDSCCVVLRRVVTCCVVSCYALTSTSKLSPFRIEISVSYDLFQ